MTMQQIHFFYHQELPVPGSKAKPVTYPVCEWRAPKGHAIEDAQHPLNRFVCSWLTSDMADVARCNEALGALAQLQSHSLAEWFQYFGTASLKTVTPVTAEVAAVIIETLLSAWGRIGNLVPSEVSP
jgi:hypothetical protein